MVPENKLPHSKLLIQLALKSLESKPIADGALDKIKYQVGDIPNIYELYSVILDCVRFFHRHLHGTTSCTPESLNDSFKTRKLPEEYRVELVKALCASQTTLDVVSRRNYFYPKLEKFRWRIDITISSSALSRVLEPSIIFEMHLSNGKKQTYEVSVPKFHELRYNIASILKEMEIIERRKIFKQAITASV